MHTHRPALISFTIALVALLGGHADADIATFRFAQVGNSYSAALLPDDPLIGREVISTRIYLDIQADPGSDAAAFVTDISFPLDPFPGSTNALVLQGSELGWSGSGLFSYFVETSGFNGVFVARRYGAETPGNGFSGRILESSRIEMLLVPVPAAWGILPVIGAWAARRRRA
jgi:hypothetical protein